ncbi:unnamed protein product [Triticum turgidum subsp. durum]|uniref:ATP-dependent RNA helicase PRP5/DDX46/KHDC4 KH domain-containing protein n=2 Tax=Triticum TaxID=4564 RepID=A0A9R0VFN4_TRITD|nr:unnamed protein product [Triticum turgidum subsp. durum]
MAEIPDSVLAVDVYCYKICRLVDPPPLHLACCSNFHRVNVKNDPGMEGLVKMANLEKLPDELIAREVVINDADPSVRHKLTKRQTQGEIAGRLSKLEKKRWRPRRTIIFCSWDAEEFALVPDPDDPSHTLYDYMIHQNPPMGIMIARVAGAGTDFAALSSTLESLHLTSLMDYIYMLSEQDDWWGTKAFPGIVSAIVSTQKLNTSEYWRLLQHEIYMGARDNKVGRQPMSAEEYLKRRAPAPSNA